MLGIVDVLHFHSLSIGTKKGHDPGNAETASALHMGQNQLYKISFSYGTSQQNSGQIR